MSGDRKILSKNKSETRDDFCFSHFWVLFLRLVEKRGLGSLGHLRRFPRLRSGWEQRSRTNPRMGSGTALQSHSREQLHGLLSSALGHPHRRLCASGPHRQRVSSAYTKGDSASGKWSKVFQQQVDQVEVGFKCPSRHGSFHPRL